MKHNILISSAGRRVSLVKEFMFELKSFFPTAKVFTSDANPEMSAACQISDFFFTVPRIDDPKYIEDILKICLENEVGIIIPTIDTELLLYSKAKTYFKSHGVSVVISDVDLVESCRNKYKTIELFKVLGINYPKLIDRNKPSFPLFIKPFNGSLSQDIYIIKNESELTSYHKESENLMYMELVDKHVFEEYTVDLYYSQNGKLKCIIPRKRIEVRGGEISKGKTVKNGIIKFVKERITVLEGACGCLTFQFFYNPSSGKILGIEINPRFGGGFPLSYKAGGNYPKWIIEEYLMGKEISFFENWAENLIMLRYDHEVFLEQ